MDVHNIPCEDYTYFKEQLDQLRKSEDNIIHRLNSLIDKSSREKEMETCGNLFVRLNEGHLDRLRLIKRCTEETEERINTMKQQIENFHLLGKEKEEFTENVFLQRLQHNVSNN
jgi:hypothetical protein